jgi:hypothetical protein
MRGSRDYYYVKDLQFADANIHEPILAAGDGDAARRVSDAVAKRLGLTEEEIASLRGTDALQGTRDT